jgi:hypothetical protein
MNKRLLAEIDPIIIKVYNMGRYSEGKSIVRHNTLIWAREGLLALLGRNRKETLKAVGEQGAELLAKLWNSTDTTLRKKIYDFFETLKHGEMPDEK